jgi:acyl-coenzyme A synthetase/AMP-(fatty) acid ligase
MSDTIPFFSHPSAQSIVAYRGGQPIEAWRFLAEVAQVAALLPDGGHVLNICNDRYRFAVGFGASLLANRVSLLPPTYTPEVIRHLRALAPDAFCLTDDPQCSVDLPQLRFPDTPVLRTVPFKIPQIPAAQVVAYVFTSGSTGLPVPHRKHWGNLVRCVRVEADRLGLSARAASIVATVPAQHMYGFETSLLVALQSASAFCAERPFYPANISAVLAAAPKPRVLVSTPVHLRALLASDVALPPLEMVVSATAPLGEGFAAEVEARLGAPLVEIYGSTETGQIASRRPTALPTWRLWPGVRVSRRADRFWAEGGHIEEPTALGDELEITGPDAFLLHGRIGDLINIAGKRTSLSYLNHQLIAIPGVSDGAFFLPDDESASPTGVTRLGALVVAPELDAATVVRQLRDRIDPVFLPRPLLFVDEIPRNATGKLPLHVLNSLVSRR